METFHDWSNAWKYDVKRTTINQRKVFASCKKIVMCTSEHRHLCSLVVTRFSKNKITFDLLNYVFVALIRGLF